MRFARQDDLLDLLVVFGCVLDLDLAEIMLFEERIHHIPYRWEQPNRSENTTSE